MSITPNVVQGLINEFNDEIYLQIQQKIAKTRPYVELTQINKEEKEITDMGGVDFKKSNAAFVSKKEVESDVETNRRLISTESFYMSHKMNTMLADMTAPGSSKIRDSITKQIVDRYCFYVDKIVYEAMDAAVKTRSGYDNVSISFEKDGGEILDFKKISDFTVKNILLAKNKITSFGYGLDADSGISWMISDIERNLIEELTNIASEEYKNAYGIVRDADANIIKFKGIDLITYASNPIQGPLLYVSGKVLDTNFRKTFMFNTKKGGSRQSAMTLGIRKEVITRLREDDNYFNTTRIEGEFHIGAMRNANSKIIEIKTPIQIPESTPSTK